MICTVTFERSGLEVEYDTDEFPRLSLLDVADQAGIEIRRGCLSGYCGSCQTELLEGSVAPIYKGDSTSCREPGFILACVSKPLSDLKVNI